MTTAIFTPDQLTNEQYQSLPQRSGSFLHRLLTHSPAKAMFGEYPAGYAILAQEKDSPYLCKQFVIFERSRSEEDQCSAWKLGRKQLVESIKIYRKCRDADIWPGLGGTEDLIVPEWTLKRDGLV